MMDGEFYVYLIFRPDFRPCYVGKGKGKRWNHHNYRATNKHLASIIKKAGGDLPKIKLVDGVSEEEAFRLEKFWIAFFGRKAHGGPLVNLTDGGEGTSGAIVSEASRAATIDRNKARIWTDEQRAKLRASRTGQKMPEHVKATLVAIHTGKPLSEEHKAKLRSHTRSADTRERIAASKRGKPRSTETKAKISAAHKGRKLSPEHRAKLCAARVGKPSPNKGKRRAK